MPSITANGVTFDYLEAGTGPLVLCLHGFPDTAHTWDDLLPALANAGYRAVAPNLRGYAPTSRPIDNDYSIPALGKDAIALINAFGAERAVVIGHDWGAMAAYCAANLAPERIDKLITMAIPHPRTLRPWPLQVRRSWYMGFFQLRGIADRRVAKNGFAFIDKLWRDWSPGWDYTPEQIAPVKAAFAEPGCLQAALGYYRALPHDFVDRDAFRLVMHRTEVPTMIFAGSRDGCIGVELFEKQQRAFTNECRVDIIENAGHFMHRERPARVNESLLNFLGSD